MSAILSNRALRRAVRIIDRAKTPEEARVATMTVMLSRFKSKRGAEGNHEWAEDAFSRVRPLLQRHGASADEAASHLRSGIQDIDTRFKAAMQAARKAMRGQALQGIGVGLFAGVMTGAFVGCVIIAPPVVAVGVGVGFFLFPQALLALTLLCTNPFEQQRARLARQICYSRPPMP